MRLTRRNGDLSNESDVFDFGKAHFDESYEKSSTSYGHALGKYSAADEVYYARKGANTYLHSVKHDRSKADGINEVGANSSAPGEYLALLIQPGTTQDCLILRQKDPADDQTYTRAGCIGFVNSEASDPSMYTGWEMRTLILI